jgi:hypothetical protein
MDLVFKPIARQARYIWGVACIVIVSVFSFFAVIWAALTS